MKRLARFLVVHRHACFAVTLCVALAAACLMPFVRVNKDMTLYIPSYMQSKVGMQLMAEEFGESSVFRVVFEDVPESKQQGIADDLAALPCATDVMYESADSDDGADYHNGSYTLYEVTVDGGTYSQAASDAHEELQAYATATEYTAYLDSQVIDAKMDNLGAIIAFALVILLIILVAMCKSWFEPILLLATLGIAVLLNMGTNVIFSSVSDTTFSIAAVFQLVLSLDYSVMLMNRYRAERGLAVADAGTGRKRSKAHGRPGWMPAAEGSGAAGTAPYGAASCENPRDAHRTDDDTDDGFLFDDEDEPARTDAAYAAQAPEPEPEQAYAASDKVSAMERAVRNAFGSIFSSSLTTIVGLVCLVLMSFTIGRDMGLVLAKGVLFSLICVFTVMPSLVLWSDRLIARTAKRSLRPRMRGMAKLSNRARFPILAIFLLVFCGGFALRNVAQASFTLPSLNPDHEVVEAAFPSGSQVVILYDRDDEEAMGDVERSLAEMDGVKSVSGYASTIGQRYTAEELAEKMDMDPLFIELLYYYKDNGGDAGGYRDMSLYEFATYVQTTVAADGEFSDRLDGVDTSGLATLIRATAPGAGDTPRTASDMASFLSSLGSLGGSGASSLDASSIQQLYLLYFMTCSSAPDVAPETLTLPVFTAFLRDTVLANELFSGLFTAEQAEQIATLAAFADANVTTTPLNAAAMANLLGMDEQTVEFLFYLADEEVMSLRTFLEFLLTAPGISDIIPEEQYAELSTVLGIIELSLANTPLTIDEMAGFLSIDADSVRKLYVYCAWENGGGDSWTISAADLISFATSDEGKEAIGSRMDDSTRAGMSLLLDLFEEGRYAARYSPERLYARLTALGNAAAAAGSTASSFGSLDEASITLLYLYRDAQDLRDPEQTESLEGFVTFLAHDVLDSPLFSSFIEDDMRESILDAADTMEKAASKLVSATTGRVIVQTEFSAESDRMTSFLADLKSQLDPALEQPYYLVGEGPMAADMTEGFMDELNFITIVTAIAIFLIVLLTFRNLAIPLILVALIQSSFFWVMALNGLAGSPMYYVAIIIVQAILMGATIDYAILFTSLYREHRRTEGRQGALEAAYRGAIPTMLTSGLILVAVTFILGIAMGGSAVAKICLTISEGAAIALFLVIFILPGVLAAFDRFVAGKDAVADASDAVR